MPATRPGTEGEGPVGALEGTRVGPNGTLPFCSSRHGDLGARFARDVADFLDAVIRASPPQFSPAFATPAPALAVISPFSILASLLPGAVGPSTSAQSGCSRPVLRFLSLPRPGCTLVSPP